MTGYNYFNKKLSDWLTQESINHDRHALHGLVEDDREFLQTLVLCWVYQSVTIHGRLHKFVGFSDDFRTTQIHRILYDVKESEPALGDTVICHGGRYQLSFIISCGRKSEPCIPKPPTLWILTMSEKTNRIRWVFSIYVFCIHVYLQWFAKNISPIKFYLILQILLNIKCQRPCLHT